MFVQRLAHPHTLGTEKKTRWGYFLSSRLTVLRRAPPHVNQKPPFPSQEISSNCAPFPNASLTRRVYPLRQPRGNLLESKCNPVSPSLPMERKKKAVGVKPFFVFLVGVRAAEQRLGGEGCSPALRERVPCGGPVAYLGRAGNEKPPRVPLTAPRPVGTKAIGGVNLP